MKTFSSGFQSKLDGESFVPVIFCRYELVTYNKTNANDPRDHLGEKVVTNYYWAEREITYDGQLYDPRIINVAPLEQTLDSSNQVFGEMGLQIVNNPTNLSGIIQPGMKVTVYYGFEDSVGSKTVTEAEKVFTGLVSGDIEITEDSMSFALIDIAHSYDHQIPRKIKRDDYPLADPDSIGQPIPVIMGRVKNHECTPIVSGFATTLAKPITAVKLAGAKARHVATAEFYVADDASWYKEMWNKYGMHTEWSGNFYEDRPYFKPFDFYESTADSTLGAKAAICPVAFIGDSIASSYSFIVRYIEWDNEVGLWKITAFYNKTGYDYAEEDYGDNEYYDNLEFQIHGYDEFGYSYNEETDTVTYSDKSGVPLSQEETFEIPVGTQITFHDPWISYSGGRWQEQDPLEEEDSSYNVYPHFNVPHYYRPNHVNTYNVFWFAVSDHAVADIKNVKINNIPIEELTDENMHLLDPDFTGNSVRNVATTWANNSNITDEFINRKTFYKVYNSDYAIDYTTKSGGKDGYSSCHPDAPLYLRSRCEKRLGNQVKAFPYSWYFRNSDFKYNSSGEPVDYGVYPYDDEEFEIPFDESLQNRALIAIFQPANKAFISASKIGAQSITSNSLEVVDTTRIVDEIMVTEPGHKHGYGAEQLFTHEIDLDWGINIFGVGGYMVQISSGSFNQTLLWNGYTNMQKPLSWVDYPDGPVQISSPWRFTSDSPSWIIGIYLKPDFRDISYYVSWRSADYTATVENINTGAKVSTIGNIPGFITYSGAGTTHRPNFVGTGYVEDTAYADAEVEKEGTVYKEGKVALLGTLSSNPNSSSDAFLAGNVTCDVVGICDGSMDFDTGIVRYPPHQMIRKLIDKYAINKVDAIDYGDGTSGIVKFEDEDALDEYFGTIYNNIGIYSEDEVYNGINYIPSTARVEWNYESPDDPSTNALIEYSAGATPSPLLEISLPEKAPNPAVNPYYSPPAVENIYVGMHNLDFAITEPNRLRDVIGEMLHHSNCVINWDNGIATIKHHPDAPAEDDVLTKQDVIMKSMSLSRKDITNLGTDVSVRFDYNPTKGYEKEYTHAFFGKPLQASQVFGAFAQERNEDLPMIREKVAAEIIAKRTYDKGTGGKFIARFDTVIKSLALEPGDFVSVEMPVFQNSFLNRGVITRKVIQWGSAVDREPDLITFEVDQNYTPDPTKIVADTLSDSVSITEVVQTYLNYEDFNYLELTDSIGITDLFDGYSYPGLADSVTITESIGFDKELKLTDSITIEGRFRRSSPLFWVERLSDRMTIVDDITAEARDSVYENGVFVETDLTTVGVFE